MEIGSPEYKKKLYLSKSILCWLESIVHLFLSLYLGSLISITTGKISLSLSILSDVKSIIDLWGLSVKMII